MNSHTKYEVGLAIMEKALAAHDGKERITTAQAAKLVGVSLRTFRYWEAAGRTPKREEPGTYTRRYVIDDIVAFADRYRKEKAMLALGYSRQDLPYLMSLPENELAPAWELAKQIGVL